MIIVVCVRVCVFACGARMCDGCSAGINRRRDSCESSNPNDVRHRGG